jgi:hypothetical protein
VERRFLRRKQQTISVRFDADPSLAAERTALSMPQDSGA